MTAAAALTVRVNGESVEVAPGATVADLLSQLELDRHRVAVELNRRVLPRAEHGATPLGDGDTLEVVTFVGGG